MDSRPLGPHALFLTTSQVCTRFSDSDWRGRPQSAKCGGAASRRLRTLQPLHSNRQTSRKRRRVLRFVERAGFEPRTVGTAAERAANWTLGMTQQQAKQGQVQLG